ncbi:hypothetical protein [Pseudomonas prosekii]|uniref:hypothetical protein n=1 Tax=Pseudomonas prosekii TaxID=1148509 RepID=UPI0015E80402|nr:hypothetical protein [Pseudomonas prosekii]
MKTHIRAKKGQGKEAVHPYGQGKHPDFPVDRKAFDNEIPKYWKDRAAEVKK